ncbi:PH domain-containing protein [Bifidobacterium vespertilionis]|uniref:PH domain-containing protein n=2 Tax=Bifidobacterium vespertilionis TaxID=2562524 RepID=A0A5J5DUD8_9BIFI|nr:PH domain-containing protein [Bifidobacterium vespertilionis]KAA8823411.1 PH domain-containing protein [Bifidobacterium vespertilionis]
MEAGPATVDGWKGYAMISFSNATFSKMDGVDPGSATTMLDGLLLQGESVRYAFKGSPGWVVFTDRRLVTVTVKGLTGKRRDHTFLPYSCVRAYGIETGGSFDVDATLDLWFGGLGHIDGQTGVISGPCAVSLKFVPGIDVREIGAFIAGKIM